MLKDIAVIKIRQKTDNERIEENKALIAPLTVQLERVATNFEHLAEQMKGSNERMDKIVESSEARLRNQGERIGLVEKSLERLDAIESDVEELKTKGSKRFDVIIEKVIYVVVGALVLAALYRIGLS